MRWMDIEDSLYDIIGIFGPLDVVGTRAEDSLWWLVRGQIYERVASPILEALHAEI